MERVFPERFTHDLWAAGTLAVFGLETRYASIDANRGLIRRHAIGYCPGPDLFVRPKPGVAVMFWTDKEDAFWTHLSVAEFNLCFPEILL